MPLHLLKDESCVWHSWAGDRAAELGRFHNHPHPNAGKVGKTPRHVTVLWSPDGKKLIRP
jgi:hypothetical protein